MGNSETERIAIQYVMDLERAEGRVPEDVHLHGAPLRRDKQSAAKIEVKALSASARGAPVPLEDRQVQAARQDPENFYLYVVDNVVRADEGLMRVRSSTAQLWPRCSTAQSRRPHTGRPSVSSRSTTPPSS